MTLKGDAKFKGKLTYSLKNDIRSLVNFHASSRKSENLHFDQMLLPKAYKDLDEKYRGVMLLDTEKWCKVWRKTDFWFQKWHERFGEFSPNYSKVQKLHLSGQFLSKVYEVWAKKNTEELSFMTLNNDAKFE